MDQFDCSDILQVCIKLYASETSHLSSFQIITSDYDMDRAYLLSGTYRYLTWRCTDMSRQLAVSMSFQCPPRRRVVIISSYKICNNKTQSLWNLPLDLFKESIWGKAWSANLFPYFSAFWNYSPYHWIVFFCVCEFVGYLCTIFFIGTTNHAPCPISLSDWPISTGNVSFYSAVSRPILQAGCPWCFYVYPVLCPKLTLIQPTWSAYPYHLVFLIWYPYSLVFLIWYPYALTSLYGNTAHCSGYGVTMGCYGLFIVTKSAIVTSQWYDRYCFTEYAQTWARRPTTPWQRECTAITDRQSIDSLLGSMRFVTNFWEITPYILWAATVVLAQSQCYSINARAFGWRPGDFCLWENKIISIDIMQCNTCIEFTHYSSMAGYYKGESKSG